MTLRAGADVARIDPGAIGLPIGGNLRTDKTARGVHDPLLASVLVLDDAGGAVVLVSLDLVALSESVVAQVTVMVKDALPLPAEVVLAATHTHSAPDVAHGYGYDELDYSDLEAWVAASAPLVGEAAGRAWRARRTVDLTVGESQVPEVAFNRRLLMPDGTTAMNWEPRAGADALPYGPVDERVTVLSLRDAFGAPVATVLHFALHPAVLVGYEWQLSADYVADLRASVQEQTGNGPVIFLNGAMGDINHLDRHRAERPGDFTEARRIGRTIGASARTALDNAAPVLIPGVRLRCRDITLRQRTVSQAEIDQAEALLERASPADADALDGITPVGYAHWTLHRGRALSERLPVTLTALRLGPVVLVFVPFEVFCSFGLWLRETLAPATVLTVSLSGAPSLGYLPTAAAFVEGGYEPTLGSSTIAAGEGERLIHQAALLVRDMLEEDGAA